MNETADSRLACLSATELNLLGEKVRVSGSDEALAWIQERLSEFSERVYVAYPDRSTGSFTTNGQLMSLLSSQFPLVEGGDELVIVDVEAQTFLAVRLENHPEDTFTVMSGSSSLIHILRCYCCAFRLKIGTWPESIAELWNERTLYRRSGLEMTADFAYWQNFATLNRVHERDQLQIALPCPWTGEVQVADLWVEDRLADLSLAFVEAAFGAPGGCRQVDQERRGKGSTPTR